MRIQSDGREKKRRSQKTLDDELFLAIWKNDADHVKELLDNGANIEANESLTPVFWAVILDRLASLNALIERGANLRKEDRLGETVLLKAIKIDRYIHVQRLLDADPELGSVQISGRYPLGHSAKLGRIECARALLNSGADINAVDQHGCSALFNAVKAGHVSMVQFLIEKGASLDIKSTNGLDILESAHPNCRAIIERARLISGLIRDVDIDGAHCHSGFGL